MTDIDQAAREAVPSSEDIVGVNFVAFPDGKHIWMLKDENYLRECIKSWQDSLPADKKKQYRAGNVLVTVGYLRMFKDDYYSIPAGNDFPWPTESGDI